MGPCGEDGVAVRVADEVGPGVADLVGVLVSVGVKLRVGVRVRLNVGELVGVPPDWTGVGVAVGPPGVVGVLVRVGVEVSVVAGVEPSCVTVGVWVRVRVGVDDIRGVDVGVLVDGGGGVNVGGTGPEPTRTMNCRDGPRLPPWSVNCTLHNVSPAGNSSRCVTCRQN